MVHSREKIVTANNFNGKDRVGNILKPNLNKTFCVMTMAKKCVNVYYISNSATMGCHRYATFIES